mgnify:CR=1 FL=1|tara:strand:- start:9491 stop:10855 length:1365 start_codon:yes stop_codon:yes gene_type:complete
MLNISPKSIGRRIDKKRYPSLEMVEKRRSGRVLIRMLIASSVLFFIIMFLPWTQTVHARGNVTTLRPDQRPQTIQSVIAGRIEKWYIQEGDYVEKGDTIVFISEVKDKFFDPNLLGRTQDQLKAKEMSVKSYMEKISALDNQIDALMETSKLKIQQTKNKLKQARLKVTSDSIDFQASLINFNIAKQQLDRMEGLYEQGLKSLTDLEQRKLSLQKAQAEMVAKENKLLTSQNEQINAKIELASIGAQYRDDIAKAESNKYTALSAMYDAEALVTKLQNEYMNYSVRAGLYVIRSPQNGYITKAIQAGIGETIKEGAEIVSIMPADFELAVAMYVKPIDLPLLRKGDDVRIQFDGWPAIVFSGWPNTSYGTYGGKVFAIDNFISDNGKYRVLVSANPDDQPWPRDLRVGAGSSNMSLLNDVFIWYELWRQINGFPPDYYKTPTKKDASTPDTKKK